MKLGIFSDAHGNVGAFEESIAILRDAGAEVLYYLGDAVGYIATPEIMVRIRDKGIIALKGNHEAMLLEPDYPDELEAVYRLRATRSLMNRDLLEFVEGLKPKIEHEFERIRVLFVHGSPNNPIYDYVYPDTDLSQFVNVSANAVFMGHTHRPFIRKFSAKMFVNVGSCGLPRDEERLGSACLFDTATCEARVIRFNIARSCKYILENHDIHESVAEILRRSAGLA